MVLAWAEIRNLTSTVEALHGLELAFRRVHPHADAVQQVPRVGVAEKANKPARPTVCTISREGEVRDGAPQASEGGAIVERLARIVAR